VLAVLARPQILSTKLKGFFRYIKSNY